jgi:hypothetical protein
LRAPHRAERNLKSALVRRPSVARIEDVISALLATSHATPEGIRFLGVIESTSTPPTREGVQMMAWAASKLGSKVKAAAWAVESSTLTSLVAPVMNTCWFLGGVPVNARFFGGVTPAAAWLAAQGTSASVSSEDIAQHVEVMRRCLNVQGGC